MSQLPIEAPGSRRASAPWNFAYIRKWNLLMERLDTMKENGYLTDEAYNHWMGVAVSSADGNTAVWYNLW